MLAYAGPRSGREAPHPKTLVLIGLAHAAVISAVMLARSDFVRPLKEPPITIVPVQNPPDPQPVEHKRKIDPPPAGKPLATKPIIDVPLPLPPILGSNDNPPSAGTATGDDGGIAGGTGNTVETTVPPPHKVVHRDALMLTSGDALRPPYPDSKRMLAEEATLTLKLTIDAAGRVTAVDPIGAADPVFLAAARKHLLRVWRFSPASDDGTPIASTRVVTLHFVLDDE